VQEIPLRILCTTLWRSRSQWPCGLGHEMSSPARTLGSWVWIPLETWMFVCVYSVFVSSCVQVAALRWADPPSKESYRLFHGCPTLQREQQEWIENNIMKNTVSSLVYKGQCRPSPLRWIIRMTPANRRNIHLLIQRNHVACRSVTHSINQSGQWHAYRHEHACVNREPTKSVFRRTTIAKAVMGKARERH
jgi:hypothetical protein